MIKVKKLKIENLGRFVGSHEVNFENKSNLIQVDAENKNTGGSSGGGKSSLFLAIEYALGLNETPATVLQSRLTKDPLSVSIELDKDGQIYTITRSKSDGLSIVGSDVAMSGSTKEAEDLVDRILGVPRDLLRPMFHKRQGEGGFFLSKTPKQSYDFLMECLGMKSLETKIERVEAHLKKSEQDLITKSTEIPLLEASLSSAKELMGTIFPPKCDVSEEVLESLQGKIVEIKLSLSSHAQEMHTRLEALGEVPTIVYKEDLKLILAKKEAEKLVVDCNQKLLDAQNVITHIVSTIQVDKNHIQIFEQGISSKVRLEEDLGSLKLQITEALKKICPTCKHTLESEHLSNSVARPLIERAQKKKTELEAVQDMENRLPIISAAIVTNEKHLTEACDNRAQLEKELSAAKDNLAVCTKNHDGVKEKALEEFRNITNFINSEKKKISDQYSPLISGLEDHLEAYNQSYYRSQASLRAHKDSVSRYEQQKASLEEKIEANSKALGVAKSLTDALNKEVLLGKVSLKFLRSYANQLFQDSLAVVADTATKILSRIPNMSTATIAFDAYKETKNGSIKEEVVAILSLDDEINIPVRSMSGGERAAIDLAVDLAVIDLVESRSGNCLDLFVLDEPFDGLDSICREMCLEVLKNHASDRKIILVDHSDQTKAMVQDVILVIREGQISRISNEP